MSGILAPRAGSIAGAVSAILLALSVSTTSDAIAPGPDTIAIECGSCPAWNAERAPFKLHGRSWYVGVAGLSAVLIDSGEGLVLIDGGLPQSAAPIAAAIEHLGFTLTDIAWIVNSHAHFDHAGGIAALARISGARVAASPAGAAGLRIGAALPDDPQAGYGDATRFPPVAEVQVIADGEPIRLGRLTLTPVFTPGHTPGGTTWLWRECEDAGDTADCLDLVYADSLTAVAAPDFRFSADGGRAADLLRASIDRVAGLPCDILIPAHPDFGGLFERLERPRSPEHRNPLVDRAACQRYAVAARAWLDTRLEKEQASTAEGGRSEP